jgi:hypothetical protein
LGYNIYIHENVTGKSLLSYLKRTKESFFSFIKSENWTAEQVLSGGTGTSWKSEYVGKGCEKVNMVQIHCIHVCKGKNDIC